MTSTDLPTRVASFGPLVPATPDAPIVYAPGGYKSSRRPVLDLFLVSFLILFAELACIRWFGSTVVFLTFFTNVVLLASFLGMSVGLLSASERRDMIRGVIPLLLLAVACAVGTFWAYHAFGSKLVIDAGNGKSPQLIYFGTEYGANDPGKFVIPLPAVAGVFFTLIALAFAGLGQAMGRAFDAIPNRVAAYTVDVLGSLTGIALFFAASWYRLSPHVWFAVILVLALYFVRRLTYVQVLCAMATMYLVAVSAYGVGQKGQLFWSPYYKIAYQPKTGDIDTNNISHQQMHRISDAGPAYALPHLLNRDAARRPFGRVCIIGAGSGNDVAAALRYGAGSVDAVEIDPVIQQIGMWDHPDAPYDDPRVTRRNDDGRSFVRKHPATQPGAADGFDLVSYALTDSLVLHSGYSSVRLESFLFTGGAFRDVRAALKPGGVFATYNFYRQGWVVQRIVKMAREQFGTEPLVVSLPYQAEIVDATDQTDNRSHITFVLTGKPDVDGGRTNARVEAIRAAFGAGGAYKLFDHPSQNEAAGVNGFVKDAAPSVRPAGGTDFDLLGPAKVDTSSLKLVPTDDWPQLYLHERAIPKNPTAIGMAVIGGLSVLILLAFLVPVLRDAKRSGARVRPNGMLFFLGAGFMLLETKGVVHMALLFGATWVVNSIVFFAILVMILLANLFVLAFGPRNLWVVYALLAATLLVNAFVPMESFLGIGDVRLRIAASCGVVFLPVLFAGIIFAAAFRDSKHPAADLGSNIAGIILGGLSEYLSMVIGFKYLVLVALGYYVLSAVLKPRMQAMAEIDQLAM